MNPERMVQQIASLRVDGADLVVHWKERSPDAVANLSRLKPGVLLLDDAAKQARCAEPLHVLLYEFRHDMDLIAGGAWSVAIMVEAIRDIARVRGWQIDDEAAA